MQADPQTESPLRQRDGSFAPLRQVNRVDARTRFLGDYSEFLAQVHALAQFIHGRMARAHLFR